MSWSMHFGCCWRCGGLLCPRLHFYSHGSCWGAGVGLRDFFHCSSAFLPLSAVVADGMLLARWLLSGEEVLLASFHMQYGVHSTPFVVGVVGFPFRGLRGDFISRILFLPPLSLFPHTVRFFQPMKTHHHQWHCMPHLCRIRLGPWSFRHSPQAFFVFLNKMRFELHPLLADVKFLLVPPFIRLCI